MSSYESKLHIDVGSEAVCGREHDTEVKMVVLLSHSNIVQALERVEQDKTAMLVRLDRLTGVVMTYLTSAGISRGSFQVKGE